MAEAWRGVRWGHAQSLRVLSCCGVYVCAQERGLNIDVAYVAALGHVLRVPPSCQLLPPSHAPVDRLAA